MKALIFDLDGVITDTAKFHYLAWKNLAKKLNIEIDEEFNSKLKGISRLDSLNVILRKNNLEDKYTSEEKEEFMKTKNEEYVNLLNNLDEKDIMPGVLKVLEFCKKNNYKTAIASASINAPLILDKLKIKHLFDVIVDPQKLKRGKPDPEIFTTAAKLLNVKISDCFGIEDAQAGINAINDANMKSIGIEFDGKLNNAWVTINNLEELDLNLLK